MRWLSIPVVLTSVLTTVVAYLWTVAIGETVLRMLTIGSAPERGLQLVFGLAGVFFVAIVGRCVALAVNMGSSYEALATGARGATPARMNSGIAILLASTHVAVIVVVVLLLILIRPSRMPAPPWLSSVPILTTTRPFTEAEQSAQCRELEGQGVEVDCGERFMHVDLNMLNVVVVASTCFVVILSVLLVLASFRKGNRHLGGVALALTASILLAHSFGSAIRVGISWVLEYLDQFASVTFIQRGEGLQWRDRFYLPYQPRDGDLFTYFYDAVPFLSLLALGALVIAIVAIGRLRRDAPRVTDLFRGSTRRLRYIHGTISTLGPRLGLAFLLGVALWSASVYVVIETVAGRTPSRFDVVVLDVLVAATNIGAVVSVLFVASGGRIHALRRTFALIADIVGFWSIGWHPLSGRPYRRVVVDGIATEVDRILNDNERVVLVGHSQGSVLCVWYLAHRRPSEDAVRLITCGSPVLSLYATFFPRFFDNELMMSANDGAGGWTNFWRETDPIATALKPAIPESAEKFNDTLIPDPRDGCVASSPRGHGDYWNEPELKAVSVPWLAPST